MTACSRGTYSAFIDPNEQGGDKIVLYKQCPRTGSLKHISDDKETIKVKNQELFVPTRVRHRFVFLVFGLQALILALPTSVMLGFLHLREIRKQLGGDFGMDKIAFLVALVDFACIHRSNKLKSKPAVAAVLFGIFVISMTLHFASLHYNGDDLIHQTVIICLLEVSKLVHINKRHL